jgi:hypothetical protein
VLPGDALNDEPKPIGQAESPVRRNQGCSGAHAAYRRDLVGTLGAPTPVPAREDQFDMGVKLRDLLAGKSPIARSGAVERKTEGRR